MNVSRWQLATLVVIGIVLAALAAVEGRRPVPEGRQEVVFWHFWGGPYRPVVERIVERFNRRQARYWVRAVAMPGSNLDTKMFLSVTGGDPPDLINQDKPIVADWAQRGIVRPLAELASDAELEALDTWLYPPAKKLGSYHGTLYGLCNGLDVRALYYNQTMLADYELQPPKNLEALDQIAQAIAPPDATEPRAYFGYLPDPRRLWAWGIVFGGQFYDPATGRVSADDPRIVQALAWMGSYSQRYGSRQVAAFRQGDQRLPGSTFPLFGPYDPATQQRRYGNYALVMDGQWRVAEITRVNRAALAAGKPVHQYGVVPLPTPAGGRQQAGWVNGNFFLVPRGARQPAGAWEFMKFWSGFGGHEAQAAQACAEGGWIPASPQVVTEPVFQSYLNQNPLMKTFVELAKSEHQVPIPALPVAALYRREIEAAGQAVMYRGADPETVLREVTQRVQARLDEVRHASR